MLIEITYNVTDVYMSTTETPVYVEISFEQPGGGAAVWGSITGTLSDQTDLQNALNLKLDESTIDGGSEGQILSKNSATDFDFAWINNYAKYLATNVRNQSGSTIAAFQVVYISGATGNKPLISLADADTEATSSKTYGVTATSIANNGTGDVVTVGELSGIDTSAFTEGDSLWLSTTAGGVVTTPPAEPAHSVFIGTVIRSHPTLGVIDVAIQNGYELNELHGVLISSAANNQGLFYNSGNGLWENKSIATALGYTPANAATTLTINGVTYDLSADRTWTISAGISGTIATGQVAYGTAANTIGGSSTFLWDNSNSRLAIGPTTTYIDAGIGTLSVVNGTTDAPILSLKNTDSSKQVYYASYNNVNKSLQCIVYGSTAAGTILGNARANAAIILGYNTPSVFAIGTFQNVPLVFGTNNLERARFSVTNGFFLLGTTTDDGVNRLQVTGNALIKGSGNTSASTALTVQNSDGTNMFYVQNGGYTYNRSRLYIGGPTTTNSIRPAGALNREGFEFASSCFGTDTTPDFRYVSGQGVATNITSGSKFTFSVESPGFNPTSGTAIYNLVNLSTTINQTGGANGITRGLYVNPTLTSAADFRAIEWSNNSGWGLYGAGTANNYLGGILSLGATTGLNSNLSIALPLSGSSFYNNVASYGTIQTSVTNAARYYFSEARTAASTSLTNLFHYLATQGSFGAGTVVNTQYGFSVASSLTGANNNYAFHSDLASGTGRWNLYMNGSASNFLSGSLAVGFTSAIFSANLGVNKSMTGGTTWVSILSQSQINSDVTSAAYSFRSRVFTQAASFTLGTLVHYSASNSGLGAGSAITNQYGFIAEADINQATNNYGFYGNIAAATGRWNLYMNGTAINYLNGALLLGSATDDGVNRLQVSGNAKVTGTTNLQGSTTAVGDFALKVTNSASTDLFFIRNNGLVYSRDIEFITSNAVLKSVANLSLQVGTAGGLTITKPANLTATSGDFFWLNINPAIPIAFSPTSGTATMVMLNINATINQTGGANGITRGLYINPTLTSAADFRAIETARGNVVFGNLPTSSAGLPTGAIWNDAGTLKIV